MVSLGAIRVLSFAHFILLCVAIGLEKFGQAANLSGYTSEEMVRTTIVNAVVVGSIIVNSNVCCVVVVVVLIVIQAGVIGLWVSQVISWVTPAFLLASNGVF
jgi:hypothetical protein